NLSSSGATSYSWTGPGGFNSLVQNPVIPNSSLAQVGTYTVTGTDAIGCSNTATTNVLVAPTPTAIFTGNPLIGCAPLCVNLTDQSTATGSTITGWAWNVTAQNPSASQHANYCLDNPGTYDVSLTVTTAMGCVSTTTIANYITVYPRPVAEFQF